MVSEFISAFFGFVSLLFILLLIALPIILYLFWDLIKGYFKELKVKKRNSNYLKECRTKYARFDLNEKKEIYFKLLKIKEENEKIYINYNHNPDQHTLLQAICAPDKIDSIASDIYKKYKIDIDYYHYYILDIQYLSAEIKQKNR